MFVTLFESYRYLNYFNITSRNLTLSQYFSLNILKKFSSERVDLFLCNAQNVELRIITV